MDDRLIAVLEQARALGFLGPGAVDAHVVQAGAFAQAWEVSHGGAPTSMADLGSGGGVPGLVLASRWPGCRVALLEASERRCAHLLWAVGQLGLAAVEVVEGRVERLARQPGLEGAFELVTARSFAPPAVTAECGARLLGDHGHLLVAEPPSGEVTERWPEPGLAELGLGPAAIYAGAARVAVIARRGPCPPRYPRRDGVPAKRPLF